MEMLVLLWPLSGIVIHIYECARMKTWCGTPIWREPTTYAMLFLAMICGPLLLLLPPDHPKSGEG